ncbi:hypothetical protein THAOC_33312, partial [Thalassiosira oceanica]
KAAATEVGFGIERSSCSAACPSGTIYIYTSFYPDICVGILGGTSAAPLCPYCRLAFRSSSDLQIRRCGCRDELIYKSTFDVANHRLMEAHG